MNGGKQVIEFATHSIYLTLSHGEAVRRRAGSLGSTRASGAAHHEVDLTLVSIVIH
jgi:hypothetical protein